MMSVSLSFPAGIFAELMAHLSVAQAEQVAFLFTEHAVLDEPLRVAELYAVPPESFDLQSTYHVTLADNVRGYVIGRAWASGGCLIEVHSHGGGDPAAFSASDIYGLDEWVPHVRWRLRGRTYVALVFAESTFDALVWEEGREVPAPLAAVQVDGRGIVSPTGITYSRFSRGRV
jgi:hypothetical protein